MTPNVEFFRSLFTLLKICAFYASPVHAAERTATFRMSSAG
jgi:hypothetical protein